MAFHHRESVEGIDETLVRPESNQARHRLAFHALWQWSDRATLEGEFGSLSRALDAGQKTVVEVARSLARFVPITGKTSAPWHRNGIS